VFNDFDVLEFLGTTNLNLTEKIDTSGSETTPVAYQSFWDNQKKINANGSKSTPMLVNFS
jgi:hypothetical protein